MTASAVAAAPVEAEERWCSPAGGLGGAVTDDSLDELAGVCDSTDVATFVQGGGDEDIDSLGDSVGDSGLKENERENSFFAAHYDGGDSGLLSTSSDDEGVTEGKAAGDEKEGSFFAAHWSSSDADEDSEHGAGKIDTADGGVGEEDCECAEEDGSAGSCRGVPVPGLHRVVSL